MRGSIRLAAVLAAMTALWLTVFPMLARTGPVATHIRAMQEGGVNPGAMFYSELEDPALVSIPFEL